MDRSLLQARIVEYSISNDYVAERFVVAQCAECGGSRFKMLMNEEQGVAARICLQCDGEHGIADSDDYFDEVDEVYPLECTCDGDVFEVMAGVALYDESEDVRWFYLGCECVKCGLSGVYGDWSLEYIGFQELLDRV